MAFDGIVVADLVHEFKKELINGRIAKIVQPENDELLLTIKASDGQKRLLISAVSDICKQTGSYDRPQFLHAPA